MTANQAPMLIVLAEEPADVKVASALQSAARALGYADGCSITQLADVPDVKHMVFERDPWSVMAIDDASIEKLRRAFGLHADELAPDCPAVVAGYMLVAVPGFAACLDDLETKRIAWHRMKAAEHPGNPLG